MLEDYVKRILSAKVYDVVLETPLTHLKLLSSQEDNNLLLKREDLQHAFSFKLRGSYNKIVNLTDAEKKRGIIAVSAGNHAQGVAYSAKYLGIKATIVMPMTAPLVKVQAVESYGVTVVLHGDKFDAAAEKAQELAVEHNYVFVSPFNDPDIIAGQGTIACEILRQYSKPIDAIVIQVGGGGLLAGIASYIKYLHPAIKIIAVEPEGASSMQQALAANKPVRLDYTQPFADGVAVSQVGEHCFELAKDLIDESITVSSDEICAAIKDIFNDTRTIAEPAGAVGVAGIKKYIRANDLQGKTIIGINSGANMDFGRLQHIAERAEIGSRNEALFAVTMPEEVGSCYKLCKTLSNYNISEFNYRMGSEQAVVLLGVSLYGKEQIETNLVATLQEHSYTHVNLTQDDLARSHIRHMVGGHCAVDNEVLLQIIFPNRPEALLDFLNTIGDSWNISLLHFRDQGATYAQVLIGLQAADDKPELFSILDKADYEYVDASDNPAYKIFLL